MKSAIPCGKELGTASSWQLERIALGLTGHRDVNPANKLVISEEDPSPAQLSEETSAQANTWSAAF